MSKGDEMSEKQKATLDDGENVIALSKSQMRRIQKEIEYDGEITDEEFQIALEAIFGPYKGGVGYNPE